MMQLEEEIYASTTNYILHNAILPKLDQLPSPLYKDKKGILLTICTIGLTPSPIPPDCVT